MKNSQKLADKIAIVTGAGRGIGRAIALTFARQGASVVIISRTESELEETKYLIESSRGNVLSIQADVSSEEEVEKMRQAVLAQFGKIDILVNNAGVLGPIGPLFENDVNQWINTININLIGTFLCTKAVIPTMIKESCGKIINLSGGGATSPRPFFSAYAASKCAVVGLTSTLAEELKAYNIQVNAISPGAVYTRIHEEVLSKGDLAGKRELETCIKTRSMGSSTIQAPADLAVFLASDESNGLTGRLISAVWDDWRHFDDESIKHIMTKELYTMRRIDGTIFAVKA
jgi:NAD(P)-dependent dehydrogenase (short-subunit alcohol dehydrogenase family)